MHLGEPFESERLHFRMLHDVDLDEIHRQFSDPEMCRYLSEPPVSRGQAQEIIEFFQHPERDNWLRYGLFSRETGEFVGTCGYHNLDRERSRAELGYDIWKAYWRRGFASEALAPMIRICFEQLSVGQVYVLIHRENTASIATAAKSGFRHCEPCRPLDETSQVCMKLTKFDWERGEDHQTP